MASEGLAWRGSAGGVSGRGRPMSMNAVRGASARTSPGGVGRCRAGARRGSGRVAGAFGFARRRGTRADRRGVLTRAMLSVDENGSGDDYEFDENFGLRAPKRERVAFETVEWHADTAQRRAKDALDVVDKSGVWTVGTTGGALLITAFDSLFDTGTVDPVALSVLAPDWISGNGDSAHAAFLYDALAGTTVDPSVVASAETTLQGVFLFEFCLRAWAERFNPAYLKSPVALVDFAATLPSVDALFGGIGGASASAALRPLRLFRLLRLLRLTDATGDGAGDADSRNADKSAKVSDKVSSVAVEFLCVFLIAGELFYDLEYEVNPAISDVGDALYWSFLTLTGIGQPFEAVTAQGRVATVGSILTALVVVPLQLAKIVGTNRDASSFASSSIGDSQSSARETPREASTRATDARASLFFSRLGSGSSRAEVFFSREDASAEGVSESSLGVARRPGDAGDAFETFDSVDEAHATEVCGLEEKADDFGNGGARLAAETDREATRSGAAYASMRRELADARARLRAFEDEVDALRAENAALRSVATRRRIKAEAERRA